MGAEYINIIILFSLVFIDIYFCWNSGFLVRRAASFLPINRWMSSFRLEREERTPEDDQPLGGQPLYLAAEITTDNISLSLSLPLSKGTNRLAGQRAGTHHPSAVLVIFCCRVSCDVVSPLSLRSPLRFPDILDERKSSTYSPPSV